MHVLDSERGADVAGAVAVLVVEQDNEVRMPRQVVERAFDAALRQMIVVWAFPTRQLTIVFFLVALVDATARADKAVGAGRKPGERP
jgi:hypothetical protein